MLKNTMSKKPSHRTGEDSYDTYIQQPNKK